MSKLACLVLDLLRLILILLQDCRTDNNIHHARSFEKPEIARYVILIPTKLIVLTKLVGSTMGSHQDLIDATKFLAQHRIVPPISHVLDGLESAEEGFELMKRGDQFGKIVIKLRDPQSQQQRSKL